MVRGNGSARAETSVKATARPNTMLITMRRGPLGDDLSTITISPFVTYIALALERVWLGMRSGTSILFEASLFEASPPPITFDYGIMVAVPMTMREINDLTDLQI